MANLPTQTQATTTADASGFKLFGQVIQPDGAHRAASASASASTSTEESTPPPPAPPQPTTPVQAVAVGGEPLPCPRCGSRETKFCYFNNYNVNQPRHFCKACHRYWTAGGALRNVPIGAGRRKNRPLGPIATVPGHHHHLHHHRVATAGYVLGFPSPSSSPTTSPSPMYADRWQVGPDRRF